MEYNIKKGIKIKIKRRSVIEYLFAFFIILDGNSVYHALTNLDLHLPVICVVLALLLLLVYEGNKLRKPDFMLAFILFIYFVLYLLFKYSTVSREAYLCIYVIGVPILFLVFKGLSETKESYIIFYRIEEIIVLLAVCSLFFWMIGSVLHIISPNMSVAVSWGKHKIYRGYFGLQFEAGISNSFGRGLQINSGMFTEGPMFVLWLSIALAVELFLKECISKRKIIILILAILTTLSTTGIFFIAMALALKYMVDFKGRENMWKLVSIIILATIMPIVINYLLNIYALKIGTSSYYIRMQDYVAGYKIWKENSILGTGYGDISSLQKYVLASRAGNVGFSNSITAILGTGGIWNFIVYILSIIVPIFGQYSRKKYNICFVICYAYLTIFLIFYARFIMAVFVAYSLSFIILQADSKCILKLNRKNNHLWKRKYH